MVSIGVPRVLAVSTPTPWLAVPLLVLATSAGAAGAPLTGGALQPPPPSLAPASRTPAVEVQRTPLPPPAEPDGLKLVIRSLHVTGAVHFTEVELLRVTGFQPGSSLALSELRAMAGRISAFYRERGYLAAQAYLPAQDIRDGVVTIAVSEGLLGQIVVRNQTSVANTLATRLLDGLAPGEVITASALESRLLLLSDLPGVVVRSSLVPGATFGTSDLLVDLQSGPRMSGSVEADNAGNRYTGAIRLGATLQLNEPLGQGDQASIRLLTSGKGLNYGRFGYQMQWGKVRASAAISSLDYALGREFDSLIAHGSSRISSFQASYPLVRSRKSNLFASLAYDSKRFQDRADAAGSVSDKTAHVLTASLDGDDRDNFWGGGLTRFGLQLASGDLTLQTPAVRASDQATAQSGGHFGKLSFSVSRLQRVAPRLSLYAALSGQAASRNLDISEKMDLGGMSAVRAYADGEVHGDQGYLASLEARWDLVGAMPGRGGQWQAIGFLDIGSVVLNRHPWSTDPNHRTLRGAGLGLNWSDASDLMVRAYLARQLGHEPSTSVPDSRWRFWIQAVSYF